MEYQNKKDIKQTELYQDLAKVLNIDKEMSHKPNPFIVDCMRVFNKHVQKLDYLKCSSVGVDAIAAERIRQVEKEGWTPEHDDQHKDGELAKAAAVYATPISSRGLYGFASGPVSWPWDIESYKPTPDFRKRELAKAGALIAAEIDRLFRLNTESE